MALAGDQVYASIMLILIAGPVRPKPYSVKAFSLRPVLFEEGLNDPLEDSPFCAVLTVFWLRLSNRRLKLFMVSPL